MANKMEAEYLEWMYSLVSDGRWLGATDYRGLLALLHETVFTYRLPMDLNRYCDGLDLRYRFGEEHGYSDEQVRLYLDQTPCSVLEMMVALSIRCEENIMDDPAMGDRTGLWFWTMVVNMGLAAMDGPRFDSERAQRIVRRFLDGEYEKDGTGGLFRVEGVDMRSMEIWYQMCRYLEVVAKS